MTTSNENREREALVFLKAQHAIDRARRKALRRELLHKFLSLFKWRR